MKLTNSESQNMTPYLQHFTSGLTQWQTLCKYLWTKSTTIPTATVQYDLSTILIIGTFENLHSHKGLPAPFKFIRLKKMCVNDRESGDMADEGIKWWIWKRNILNSRFFRKWSKIEQNAKENGSKMEKKNGSREVQEWWIIDRKGV